MKKVMVRYKVKSGAAEENKRLIQEVFRELNANKPEGIKYHCHVMADGVSFIHFASIYTADGVNPLSLSPAFKTFTQDIKDRCEEPPLSTELTEVGSYGF